jgi:alpha-mannosidase
MRICLPTAPLASAALVCWAQASLGQNTSTSGFTRLNQLPSPRIVASADAHPGGQYEAANLVDGVTRTEYASNGKGTNTFVEFDFGRPVQIVAFQHIDRNDPATVAAAELSFSDENGKPVTKLDITNVNQRGGITFKMLPSAVTAQRVRWQVTQLGSGLGTVGGAELAFFSTGLTDAAPVATTIQASAVQLLEYKNSALVQPLSVTLDYPYAEPLDGTIEAEGAEATPIHLGPGNHTLEILVTAAAAEKPLQINLKAGGQTVATQTITQKPVRKLEIFLLPHSHVDIGYTALQADVEKKQNSNIETGIRLAQASGDYPPGARFKWNVEVLWPVENYLRDASPQKRDEFIAAVRSGQVGLDAFYANTLTGLCRPEELLNLMGYATRLSELCGVPIRSAMISDVPGYTWSTVSAMAQAGIRYFSFAPNYFDRMGATMKEWQNRPFWWRGPDRFNRVLCWCPSRGYALGHLIGDGEALARFIPNYLVELETNGYPYDITYLRWNVHGDNGSPDEKLADVVRDWNARYVYPHLVISTTAETFSEFERRYGDRLPEFSGDYTPYWEDGAASSALETAMNRASAERLVQAETVWALRNPERFPAASFQGTWRDILLYSEHTWGAHNSISEPDLPFVRDQWKVKRGFALDADRQSRDLLKQAGASEPGSCASSNSAPLASRRVLGSQFDQSSSDTTENIPLPGQIEVLNTSSWPRTDLVTLSAECSTFGDEVVEANGKPVLSQRLSTGELAFLARDVPLFASKRFWIQKGTCPVRGAAVAEIPRLISGDFFVRVSEKTGGIAHLFSRVLGRELLPTNSPAALNDYFYLPGSDLANVQRDSDPRISVKESGPLVASLLIQSTAPGCKKLSREIRVIDGLNRLEIINTVDKLAVRTKEGVHFAFRFDVPKGVVRMDVGWAEVRPELDQIPAACKNWFSVQRWVDISNDRFGVTWSPVDAPLVEVGGITANLVGSQTDPRAWIQHLAPSQTLYSWVMNNHWHTNYRAEQEGPTVFRYAISAHRRFAPEDAAKFGVACSQPLLIVHGGSSKPRLKISGKGILATAFKPADDGQGWIIRLFGASGKAQTASLRWEEPVPRELWLSNLSEKPLQKINEPIVVPGWGIVTLLAK